MEKGADDSGDSNKGLSKDGSANSVSDNSEEDTSLRPYKTQREKLKELLHSHKFQVTIIALVIVDCLLVVAELILDIRGLELHDNNPAPHILHYMSIAILSVFIIEIFVKIYAFRLEFFRHKLEMFDAIVVFLSFALDITFRDEESMANALGLVIVVRLWRVARVLNGIVMSVKTQAEHKLLKERRLREEVEQELQKCRDYIDALENEVNFLRQILESRGIKELPPSVVAVKNVEPSKISVVVEVNHTESASNK